MITIGEIHSTLYYAEEYAKKLEEQKKEIGCDCPKYNELRDTINIITNLVNIIEDFRIGRF